ncbi:MAG TPA: agmatine deiminase family protein [Pirellulales bacterium]|nr:agmatine deiminase family protein [Pirellulales bacterium]
MRDVGWDQRAWERRPTEFPICNLQFAICNLQYLRPLLGVFVVNRSPVPAALGYRMPAEWEPHAATWLSWPHNRDSWPGQFEPVPGIWAELVRVLSGSEPVHILAGGEAVMGEARRLVGHLPNITLHDIPTNDAWMRDHGPMFLVGPADTPPALVDWGYNAWGGKYPPFDLDQQVPRRIAELLGFRRIEPGIVLEGGAIDVNGSGSVLTTEQCLLNPNRNAGLTRAEIERYLDDYCGTRHAIWLGGGIVGDDTDGHIDELARFVSPRTVVAAVEDDPHDANYEPLHDNLRRLRLARDEQGRPLEVVLLPMPAPVFFGEHRLPASYMNFYIANRLVVVPQFGDAADSLALDMLARLFPDRRVCGLRAVELAWGLGAFHCITQQQPA